MFVGLFPQQNKTGDKMPIKMMISSKFKNRIYCLYYRWLYLGIYQLIIIVVFGELLFHIIVYINYINYILLHMCNLNIYYVTCIYLIELYWLLLLINIFSILLKIDIFYTCDSMWLINDNLWEYYLFYFLITDDIMSV